MPQKRSIIASHKGVFPGDADDAWLASLSIRAMSQFKRILEEGGRPLFVLAQDSTVLKPVWLLLAIDKNEQLFRVTTATCPLARRLESIKQVYLIARTCNLDVLDIPVERRR